jgi:IS5 family transposase
MRQKGFFDEDDRLKELSKLGDPLEKLNTYIDWEQFKGLLSVELEKEPKELSGRPPFDYVMMFKILILQRIYNISDAQAEYQIKDRRSFMRYLSLTLNDRIPDEKTRWEFRDKRVKAKIAEIAFCRFTQQLEEKKIITYSGSLTDASFVEAPRQRNSREENETIKEGKIPEDWEKKGNRNKRRQKDTEARWAKKNDEKHYGYKDHVKVDKHSKRITRYTVTNAAVYDSQELKNLIEAGKDKRLYADSAYTGKEIQSLLPEDVKNRIHEKGYRGKPLTKKQERKNKKKSHLRARVEHAFGHMTQAIGGMAIRYTRLARAKFAIGLMNLAYNIQRYVYLRSAKRCVSL